MTREEAIQILADLIESPFLHTWEKQNKALHMAIEALSEPNMIPIKLEKRYPHSRDEDITDAFMRGYQSAQAELVRCKDCRHANECHKNVQHTRNELNTVTIGYSPIEWCSRGERREP